MNNSGSISPRENLLNVFRKNSYRNVPVQFDLCPALCREFEKKTGSKLAYQEYFEFPMREIIFPDPEEIKKIDRYTYYRENLKKGTAFDAWGIAREPGSKAAAHMTRMRHPLKNIQTIVELKKYPFPDYTTVPESLISAQVESIHTHGLAAYGFLEMTVWETAWYLRDMTTLMMDMAIREENAYWLLDKVTEQSVIRASVFARAGVDVLKMGDDLGMQTSILMSIDHYRKFIKPRHKKIIESVKSINPNILIHYHSCGYVTPLIDDFIDIGVDILNPVQPESMDFAEIHKKYGDRLSFSGTLGTQTTMPFGTADEVRETVHRNLDIAGEKGGLLCCPTHMLEPEVPWENIMAYVEACRDYTA